MYHGTSVVAPESSTILLSAEVKREPNTSAQSSSSAFYHKICNTALANTTGQELEKCKTSWAKPCQALRHSWPDLHIKVNKKLMPCFDTNIKSIKVAAYESQYFKILLVADDVLQAHLVRGANIRFTFTYLSALTPPHHLKQQEYVSLSAPKKSPMICTSIIIHSHFIVITRRLQVCIEVRCIATVVSLCSVGIQCRML